MSLEQRFKILVKFYQNFTKTLEAPEKNSEISYIKLIYVLYNNNISFRFNFFLEKTIVRVKSLKIS